MFQIVAVLCAFEAQGIGKPMCGVYGHPFHLVETLAQCEDIGARIIEEQSASAIRSGYTPDFHKIDCVEWNPPKGRAL